MEIADSCWDIFHIIEHLEKAEMLTDYSVIPVIITTGTTLKRKQMGGNRGRKAGTARHIRKVWAVGSHCRLGAVVPCLLSGTPRTQLMFIH